MATKMIARGKVERGGEICMETGVETGVETGADTYLRAMIDASRIGEIVDWDGVYQVLSTIRRDRTRNRHDKCE